MRGPSFVIPKPMQLSFRELTLCRRAHVPAPFRPLARCIHAGECQVCPGGSLAYDHDDEEHVCINCGRPGPVATQCK